MFLIEGKYNSAKCFAEDLEPDAVTQIKSVCDTEFSKGSNIAIMPDAHFGVGCTIGTTMTVTDKVVPNLVGVDVGCGVLAVSLGHVDLDLAQVDEACHYVPSGRDVWDERVEKFPLSELRCYRDLKDQSRLNRSLGTLGGGNHFIEVDKSSSGEKFLVVHSGSRNLGTQIATYYQKLAVELHSGKNELFKQKSELIAKYKAEGRRSEIQSALLELTSSFESKSPDVPEELCWLYGTWFDDYIHDMKICQDFARRNRELIARTVVERCGLSVEYSFQTVHNYIDTDSMILRKGSISAKKGERVLIPINMRDGSVLATGIGNPEWNWSAPHGAGRVMSRRKARETLSMNDYVSSMEGVYTTSVKEDTLDEAPMAYKPLNQIVEAIKSSVNVEEVIKPIFNFKA